MTIRRLMLALAVVSATGCGEDVNATLEKVSEARQISADLLVQFTRTADAANRAVDSLTTMLKTQGASAGVRADADEAVMTRMETQMATSEMSARKALDALRPLVAPSSTPALNAAAAALTRFMDLNTQIIALSRRNTNVRSLALSLDQKRTITMKCEESLHALQAALAKRGYSGIRAH